MPTLASFTLSLLAGVAVAIGLAQVADMLAGGTLPDPAVTGVGVFFYTASERAIRKGRAGSGWADVVGGLFPPPVSSGGR